MSKFVSISCLFIVRSRVNTACERDDLNHAGASETDQWNDGDNCSRLVHVSSSDRPRLVTFVHKRHHLMIIIHNQFGKILHIRA